jgi:hypothetical protein
MQNSTVLLIWRNRASTTFCTEMVSLFNFFAEGSTCSVSPEQVLPSAKKLNNDTISVLKNWTISSHSRSLTPSDLLQMTCLVNFEFCLYAQMGNTTWKSLIRTHDEAPHRYTMGYDTEVNLPQFTFRKCLICYVISLWQTMSQSGLKEIWLLNTIKFNYSFLCDWLIIRRLTELKKTFLNTGCVWKTENCKVYC